MKQYSVLEIAELIILNADDEGMVVVPAAVLGELIDQVKFSKIDGPGVDLWNNAPIAARFAAKDANGGWHYFRERPIQATIHLYGFNIQGWAHDSKFPAVVAEGWEDSLEEKPVRLKETNVKISAELARDLEII